MNSHTRTHSPTHMIAHNTMNSRIENVSWQLNRMRLKKMKKFTENLWMVYCKGAEVEMRRHAITRYEPKQSNAGRERVIERVSMNRIIRYDV